MLSFLQKYTAYFLLVATLIIAGLFFYNRLPCIKPLTYKIGTVDPGFHISRSDFLYDISTAASLWNQAIGKKLFQYDPQGELTINLKYDDRQKAVQLRETIDASGQTADSLKKNFETLKQHYETLGKQYESEVSAYNAANKYNRDTVDHLQSQRRILESLGNEVQKAVDAYNSLIRDINAKVTVVNKTAGEVEEGLYSSGPNTIDVYQYDSAISFTRLLAHELGHALGLDHNEDSEAIMYKLNQGKKAELTGTDLQALKALCSTY